MYIIVWFILLFKLGKLQKTITGINFYWSERLGINVPVDYMDYIKVG